MWAKRSSPAGVEHGGKSVTRKNCLNSKNYSIFFALLIILLFSWEFGVQFLGITRGDAALSTSQSKVSDAVFVVYVFDCNKNGDARKTQFIISLLTTTQ